MPVCSDLMVVVLEMLNVRRAIKRFTNALVSLCFPQGGDCELPLMLSRLAHDLGPNANRFRITTEGLARPLRSGVRDEVFRISREGLFNAFRHSQASQIEIELHFTANYFGMLIHDNGRGMDSERLSDRSGPRGGLLEMSERAERIGAQFRVMSRVALGTEIQLLVPGGVAFEPQNFESLTKRLPPVMLPSTDRQ